jgi:hypothetical protein
MAHIVCSAEKVREAAQLVIKNIEETRTKRDEKAIARVMEKERVCWWKFWQPAGMTREQAIKWLDASDMWGWRSGYAWGDLSKAEKLLLLAEHGDPVTIDEESARVLWG